MLAVNNRLSDYPDLFSFVESISSDIKLQASYLSGIRVEKRESNFPRLVRTCGELPDFSHGTELSFVELPTGKAVDSSK